MSIHYPSGCSQTQAGYNANCCPTKEGARIRHIAWIKDTVPDSFNPTDSAEWNQYIESGEIIIVANTRGSSDGGSWAESDGFGDTVTELEGYTEVVTYTDRLFLSNVANYNAITASKNYRLGFFTATKGYISDNPATFKPKRPINADAKQSVYGEIEASFTQNDMPEPFTYPQDIFQCFNVIN